jgi:hypothetical protein
MVMGSLNRRVERLETIASVGDAPSRCTTCGWEHARQVTLAELRSLLRVMGGTSMPELPSGTVRLGPFCLCGCCLDYRGLAELTH